MKVVVTGGAGFIGSNLVSELLLSDLNIKELHVIDKLSYAGSLANLGTNLDLPNVFFHKEDICDQSVMSDLLKDVDYIFNLAAESHVDRSITDAAAFWNSNVLGTVSLLESIKNRPGVRFLHVSTDEVYGSTSDGKFMETDPIKPSSPYSASKAASDLACMAYSHTYGVDYLITRCTNNFGPNQYPEKLIPVLIQQAVHGKPLTLYGDGRHIREWIPVKIHAKYLIKLMFSGLSGEVINIGSGVEKSNLQIAELILSTTNSSSQISFIEDRLGHDYRYSVSTDKLNSFISKVDYNFDLELSNCVREIASKLIKE